MGSSLCPRVCSLRFALESRCGLTYYAGKSTVEGRAALTITPNLNTPARAIYALLGLALIVWAGFAEFATLVTIVFLAAGVILLAEAGAGW